MSTTPDLLESTLSYLWSLRKEHRIVGTQYFRPKDEKELRIVITLRADTDELYQSNKDKIIELLKQRTVPYSIQFKHMQEGECITCGHSDSYNDLLNGLTHICVNCNIQ